MIQMQTRSTIKNWFSNHQWAIGPQIGMTHHDFLSKMKSWRFQPGDFNLVSLFNPRNEIMTPPDTWDSAASSWQKHDRCWSHVQVPKPHTWATARVIQGYSRLVGHWLINCLYNDWGEISILVLNTNFHMNICETVRHSRRTIWFVSWSRVLLIYSLWGLHWMTTNIEQHIHDFINHIPSGYLT